MTGGCFAGEQRRRDVELADDASAGHAQFREDHVVGAAAVARRNEERAQGGIVVRCARYIQRAAGLQVLRLQIRLRPDLGARYAVVGIDRGTVGDDHQSLMARNICRDDRLGLRRPTGYLPGQMQPPVGDARGRDPRRIRVEAVARSVVAVRWPVVERR